MEESDADFIARMYSTHLGREAEADGAAAWVYHLQGGVQRADVEQCFINCEEAKARK